MIAWTGKTSILARLRTGHAPLIVIFIELPKVTVIYANFALRVRMFGISWFDTHGGTHSTGAWMKQQAPTIVARPEVGR